VSAAGSDAQPLADAGTVSHLYRTAWSPDNTTIAYFGRCGPPVPKGEPNPNGPLCLFNIESQEHVPFNVPYEGLAPTWSPDSRYIALTGLTPNTDVTTILEECGGPGMRWNPANVCLYRARSIYLVDTQTGDIVPITEGIAPTWSPDGSRIVFLSNRSGAPEVWTVRPDGSDLRQMTTNTNPKVPQSLAWLPVGIEVPQAE